MKSININYFVKILLYILPIVLAVVSLSVYLSAKPDRGEVRVMIHDSVDHRLQLIQNQLDVIHNDIKSILREGNK